ncbi:hypothetical protein PsorP6_016009 [Peronosclerospora sorghi]|uniref:Uncharacterized protein n=1 Tax=Peronosclerospora sorghi TaxID=230839 RepID=A0ACC0WQN6_9STRA|nr:hypothetical protein PsorP6_016009 [Peronosclerospora sorghi]
MAPSSSQNHVRRGVFFRHDSMLVSILRRSIRGGRASVVCACAHASASWTDMKKGLGNKTLSPQRYGEGTRESALELMVKKNKRRCMERKVKFTRRGTRTRNPQIRSLIRYPLRQPRLRQNFTMLKI